MKNVHKINPGQWQPEDGGEGEGFIHFHDNSHREKKWSPASPQGLELNSQGCQSDQEFNSIYSVGRLSGASTSASGWCPEPAHAEQPESWICLAGHAMRDSGHMHTEVVSLIYGNISWRVREGCIISLKLKWQDTSFRPEITGIWKIQCCCRPHSHKAGSWLRLSDWQRTGLSGSHLEQWFCTNAGKETQHVTRLALFLGWFAKS